MSLLHIIDLNEFLREGNITLVELENIQYRMKIYFIYLEEEDISLERVPFSHKLRDLFNAISASENIIEVDFGGLSSPLPGILLAAWFYQNKYVTTVNFPFFENQSEIELLCKSIQESIVTTRFFIIIRTMQLAGPKAKLLGTALRKSSGIVHVMYGFCVDIVGDTYDQEFQEPGNPHKDVEIIFLKEMLGRHSNITSASFIFAVKPSTAKANLIKDIISANSSLISLKITPCTYNHHEYIIPILQGVAESNITDFRLDFYSGIQRLKQPLIFQMIGKMKKLKSFSFDLDDFGSLSPDFMGIIIRKNCSLQEVSLLDYDDENPSHLDARKIIDRELAKNKLLAEAIAAPESIPNSKWPLLLQMGKMEGLDFSFQILPYLFAKSLICNLGDENTTL